MQKWLAIFGILVLVSCGGSVKNITDGSVAYSLKKYQLAKQLLPSEIAQSKDFEVSYTKTLELAKSYEAANEPLGAIKAYKDALTIKNDPVLYMALAQVQKQAGLYEDAITALTEYQELTGDVYGAKNDVEVCETALAFNPDSTNLFVQPIEALNTSSADYASGFYINGALVVSSTRKQNVGDNKHPWTGQKPSDIYLSTYQNGFVAPESFSTSINTEVSEGGMTFTKDFNTAYFTRCGYSEEYNQYCRLYKTERYGDEWTEPELLPLFGDSINVGQAFLSPKGDQLFYVSEAPFGYGGKDIYYSVVSDTGWSQPINAGFYVNTDGDEMFPTMDANGTLYFSSNGRVGFGGLDLYKSEPDKASFSQAEHLPLPINSGGDDFGYLPFQDKNVLESAVFSSSRVEGKGFDDIYMYQKRLVNIFDLTVTSVEKQYEDSLDANSKVLGLVPLKDAEISLRVINEYDPNVTLDSDENGEADFALKKESVYKVLVSKEGYFNKSISVSTSGLSDPDNYLISLFREVELEKIFPEKEIVINNIYYDYDKASLREESLPTLDTLVSFFEENSDLTIEIGSHTDSRGSDSYNEELSQRRAQSVVDYFVSKGISKDKLQAKGYGESKITNRCENGVTCSEEEHQENRRTTFRVVSADGVLESN